MSISYKKCSKCGNEKPVSEFYTDSNPRNLTGRQSRCMVCAKKSATEYAKANKDKKAAADKRYREAHPEKMRELDKRKLERNPEHYRALATERQKRYRERNPGCGLKGNAERLKRWRKLHPEREASTQAARRVVMKRIPAWGEPELIEIVYTKAKEYKMEVDHIVPIKHPLVCGLHVWYNLQLLKRKENRAKKNTHWPDMP